MEAFYCPSHECRCGELRNPESCECGAFGGYAGEGTAGVIYVCEECAAKFGSPPGIDRLPDPPPSRNVFTGADFGSASAKASTPKIGVAPAAMLVTGEP